MRTAPKRVLLALAAGLLATFALLAPSVQADGPKFDPKEADFISHIMIMDGTELPGEGWDTTAKDKFDDDSAALPDVAACNNSLAKLKTLSKGIESSRAGRAQAAFNNGEGVDVEMTVEIYKDEATLTDLIKKGAPLFASKDFDSCFVAILKDSVSPSDKITVKAVEPYGKAPHSGIAKAIEVEISSLPSPMHFEFYTWNLYNSLISLNLSGDKTTLTQELAGATVDSAELSTEIVALLAP